MGPRSLDYYSLDLEPSPDETEDERLEFLEDLRDLLLDYE